MYLALLIFATGPVTIYGLSLSQCTDPSYMTQDYTFLVDRLTGERVWSHCHFPDPRYDHAFCGLPASSDPYFICDPDHLLSTSDDVSDINAHLVAVQTNTSTQCRGPDGTRQSFLMAIVLVDRIRVGAPFQTDSCVNDCGEINPTINTTLREPTGSELDVAMRAFADGLRRELSLGACGNDIVLFYSKTYNRVYTSMGSRAADILDSETLSEIHNTFLGYVKDGRLRDALLFVAQKFRSELRGLTPADIMLIITIISAVLLFVFMMFYLSLHEKDYNAWGNEKGWVLADVVVRALTGLLLLEWGLMVMMQFSARAPLWPVVIMLTGFIASLVVYFTTDNFYTRAVGVVDSN